MKKLMGLLSLLTIVTLTPGRAEAQRGGRGTVNTPFGQFNSNEMRNAGGNPFAAEELRQQKMMVQQQQMMMKQEQQYQQQIAQQQKARADYLKKHPEEARAAATKPMTKTSKTAKKKAATKAATEKSAAAKQDEATNPKVPGAPAGAPKP